MFESMEDEWDLVPGQPDPESAESMALWRCGLLEDPIDERDYRAAEASEYYSDLALFSSKERSEGNEEFTSDDLEDLDER